MIFQLVQFFVCEDEVVTPQLLTCQTRNQQHTFICSRSLWLKRRSTVELGLPWWGLSMGTVQVLARLESPEGLSGEIFASKHLFTCLMTSFPSSWAVGQRRPSVPWQMSLSTRQRPARLLKYQSQQDSFTKWKSQAFVTESQKLISHPLCWILLVRN